MSNPETPCLLRIDASARLSGSISRQLADAIELRWRQTHPEGMVRKRDLALEPIPHISDLTIQGYYTPPSQMTHEQREATALSDRLITELKAAHLLLISAPIYNFSTPSSLKAWIDQTVRINHTFAYDGKQFTGLLNCPRAVLALAYGAGGYQDALLAMDHLRPYLTQLLGFLGVARVDTISVEASTADANTVAAAVRAAEAQIPALFESKAA